MMQKKPFTWQDRMAVLREKKNQQTQEKIERNGYMDGDDYGTVVLPADWHFEPKPNHENGGFYGAKAWSENYEALMAIHPVYVDPLEILCGRWRTMLPSFRQPWPEDLYSFDALKEGQKRYGIGHGIGADSHFCGDYAVGLSLGFGGILEKIRECRLKNPGREEFYDAHERVYLAVQNWIDRHIAEIDRLLETETRAELADTLRQMRACNVRVREQAPETFLEACQWMAWFACASRIYDRDGAGCRLDLILQPYYDRDVKAGILDREKATFIIANLLLIDPHYYQLSGADDEGNDQTCPVSWLILDAAHWMDASANLTVRVHDKTDPEYFSYAVSYLFKDRKGWPRFSGHKGLMHYEKNLIELGFSPEEAHHIANSRIAVGCNWMAVPGLEYCMNDCVKINVAKVFEVAYQELMEEEQPGLERLWKLFCGHLKEAVRICAEGVLFHLQYQHLVMPELMLNPLMEGCLEKGENITQCARIITIGVDGVGLGTVADSFAALEQRIEKEKRISWQQVYEAIQKNFEGEERLRLMMAGAERYCGGGAGDVWAKRISELFAETVKAYPMPEGKVIVPGWFSWSDTIGFGKQVGATPNGRKAWTPVTHGANPTPGFRKDGAATAMATGIAAIQPNYGNTAPLQIELDPKLSVEEGGIERVMQLIKTHIDMGGTLVNINVLDKKTLMEAHENPATHPDLVVRVTGFTAYFAALSPQFRQLVVDRFVEGA